MEESVVVDWSRESGPEWVAGDVRFGKDDEVGLRWRALGAVMRWVQRMQEDFTLEVLVLTFDGRLVDVDGYYNLPEFAAASRIRPTVLATVALVSRNTGETFAAGLPLVSCL